MDELETIVVETLSRNFEFLRSAAEKSPYSIADLFQATINNFLGTPRGYAKLVDEFSGVGEKVDDILDIVKEVGAKVSKGYEVKDQHKVSSEETYKEVLKAYRESALPAAISELRDAYSRVESDDVDAKECIGVGVIALSVLMDHGESLFETTTRVGIDKDGQYEVLADSRSIAKLAGYSPEPLRTSGKILIAEGDAAPAELAKRLLERVGYEVVHVKSVEEALDELSQAVVSGHEYAAVITCGALAGNGKDLALRATMVYKVPVVGMTASFVSDPSVVSGLKAAGATYVIVKPFDNINSVVTAVESAIAQKMDIGGQ